MNISADVVERILFESTQLGQHADQVRLLDVEHTAAGFAKNLRGIWEILFLRATGEYLPSTEKDIQEVEELQFRTANVNFVQPLSQEELERVSIVSIEEDDTESVISKDSEKQNSITDSIDSSGSRSERFDNSSSLQTSFQTSLQTSLQTSVDEEPTRTSVVLETLIKETNKHIHEPAVVPIKTFNFSGSIHSAGSLDLQEDLAVGFGDDKECFDFKTNSEGRDLQKYNEILERRTTVYDGTGQTDLEGEGVHGSANEGKRGKKDAKEIDENSMHLQGSFTVNAPDDDIDEEMQSALTRSSIIQIEMRYCNSSLYSAEEDKWTDKQKMNKIELLTKIKMGNFFALQKKKNRKSRTPDPKRTVTTPRTPLSREYKTRRSRPAPIVDKRATYKELKHVSVEFGFADFDEQADIGQQPRSPGRLSDQGTPNGAFYDDNVALDLPLHIRSKQLSSGQEKPYISVENSRHNSRQHSRQHSRQRSSQHSRLQSRQQSREGSQNVNSRQGSPLSSRQGMSPQEIPHFEYQDSQLPSPVAMLTQQPTPEVVYLSSPKAKDIASSFSPLTSYATNQEPVRTVFFPPNFQNNTIFEKEDDDQSEDTRVSYAQAVFQPEHQEDRSVSRPTGPAVSVQITDVGNDAFSAFQSRSPKSPKAFQTIAPKKSRERSRGSNDISDARGRSRNSSPSRTSPIHSSHSPTRRNRSPISKRTLTRSPARSPTTSPVRQEDSNRRSPQPSEYHVPKAPASKTGHVGRPSNIGIRMKNENAVKLSSNDDSQTHDNVNELDENSASTMFSIMISVIDPEEPKPPQSRQRKEDDAVLCQGAHIGSALLNVSDSFVDRNNASALKVLPHRPIKRLPPKSMISDASGDDAVDNSGDTQDTNQEPKDVPSQIKNDNSKRVDDKADHILTIVGNVSPRLLDDDLPNRDQPIDALVPRVQQPHKRGSHSDAKRLPQQLKQRRRTINKQTLKLSLPMPNLTEQDSHPMFVDIGGRFDKPIKRNLSADSFSDFNLSVMSMSVAESIALKDTSRKNKESSKSVVTSKYMQPAGVKRSSTVYFSKLKSDFKNNFTVKYPLQVKG